LGAASTVELTEQQFETKFCAILEELFCSQEVEDAAMSIKEAQSAKFHGSFVCKALTISCEKKEKDQKLLMELFDVLLTEKTLTIEQLITGYVVREREREKGSVDARLLLANIVRYNILVYTSYFQIYRVPRDIG
jgi:hypothetical protein